MEARNAWRMVSGPGSGSIGPIWARMGPCGPMGPIWAHIYVYIYMNIYIYIYIYGGFPKRRPLLIWSRHMYTYIHISIWKSKIIPSIIFAGLHFQGQMLRKHCGWCQHLVRRHCEAPKNMFHFAISRTARNAKPKKPLVKPKKPKKSNRSRKYGELIN